LPSLLPSIYIVDKYPLYIENDGMKEIHLIHVEEKFSKAIAGMRM
jgi:hypothetical protein